MTIATGRVTGEKDSDAKHYAETMAEDDDVEAEYIHGGDRDVKAFFGLRVGGERPYDLIGELIAWARVKGFQVVAMEESHDGRASVRFVATEDHD